MQTKLKATDVIALIADYEHGKTSPDLKLIQGALLLSGNALAADPAQFAGQMVGRLLPHRASPAILNFLSDVAASAPAFWLRPLHPALLPPGTELVLTLEGHTSSISSVAVRPDGKLAVSGAQVRVFDQAVLAAGAHSRRLFGSTIARVPLETERGYHVVFGNQGDIISRTCSSATAGFAMAPMNEGLRCAGMVELAGLDKPPNPACHAYLERTARRFLPDLRANPSSKWMGFRPSMPDALPVIGRSPRTPEIILAFGHHHVGMSSGCVTGRIVAALAAGEPPPVDITPFSPDRF